MLRRPQTGHYPIGGGRVRILYHHRTLGDGAEGIHVASMIEAWRSHGHDVRVVSVIGQQTNVTTSRTRLLTAVRRSLPLVAYELMEMGYSVYGQRALERTMAAWRPDVIYERYTLYNFAGVSTARRHGIPLILEVNAPLAYERAQYEKLVFDRFARRAERTICSRADSVVVVSSPLRDYLVEEGVPANRILVLPNGADPNRFAPSAQARRRIREQLGIGPHVTVVGFTGILRPWHGVEFLLEAAAAIDPLALGVHMLIVGDGPSLAELQQWVRARGLDRAVTFTGRVSHEAVPDYVAAFDVGVSPRATFYASPMKVPEYMAAGLAVVAPRMPNLEDLIVDGCTGLLFEPESVASLAAVLGAVASNATYRQQLAAAARASILDGRTWSHNATRVLDLVRELQPCA
jgi:glycosyltransferase involved in cell wall biosynthesis